MGAEKQSSTVYQTDALWLYPGAPSSYVEKTRSDTLADQGIPLAACGRKQQTAAGALYVRFAALTVRCMG
eukprot:COSAG01_NODE_13408_length_1589_cov_2.651678_2_plen_70_part_00